MREALLPPFLHGALTGGGPGFLGWTLLIAGLLLAFYGVKASLRTAEGRAFFLAGLAAAAVSGAGLLRPAPPPAVVPSRNPVPLTAESVEAGRRVYEVHCAACHGQQGAGDGPAAAGLARGPADLRLHVPMHSDGQLYLWITVGVPGNAMPPFGDRLSDEDRWHVVNYLRVLALSAR
ncbi:MAG: c-type cytochrome [Armatimonadota bacterium]|nr:c-type cytochrome [Armatimonadota bacterium]MDR7389559.1 c-type cytochrome [Armatimonadota bacterium]MDR7392231.1 c-type cytochrome [Armatimonadota bacterium]MDR7393809.1 c-type cytochrome [Armatimonadota bacterium]MDR7397424.1 c-type cytochrome [Armatimonadota bacterium]